MTEYDVGYDEGRRTAMAECERLRAAAETDALEIIRLQHEWANANGDAIREMNEAAAEIARLREALWTIFKQSALGRPFDDALACVDPQ